MLGMILGFISLLNDIKCSKIKKLKKRIEEKSAELVDTYNDKSAKLKQLSDKEKTAKFVSFSLKVLSMVITFLDIVPLLLMLLFWFLAFLAVIVLVLIVSSLFAAIGVVSDGDNGIMATDNTTSAVTSGSGEADWSEEELAVRGGKLSGYEKNLYRLIMLSAQTMNGTFGDGEKTYDKALIDSTLPFTVGLVSIESSMSFYNNKKDNETKSITEYPSDKVVNSAGYGPWGVEAAKPISSYFSSITEGRMKTIYKPKVVSSPASNFAPYGIPMSTKHTLGNMNSYVWTKKTSKIIEDVMDSYGIKENRAKLKGIVEGYIGNAQYHGAQLVEYPAYAGFLCGVWAASSDVDAKRSLDGYSFLNYNEYAESAVRHCFVGTKGAQDIEKNGDFTNICWGNSNIKLGLNGVALPKPLWGFMHDKYKGKNKYYDLAERTMLEFAGLVTNANGGGRGMRVLNFHYGLNSYIHGNRIIKMVTGKLTPRPNGSGGVIGQFNPTPGVGQGVWGKKSAKERIDMYLKVNSNKRDYMNGLIAQFGKAEYVKDGTNIMGTVWKSGKYSVPFYCQIRGNKEAYKSLRWHPNNSSGDTIGSTGCMIYAHSYVASALTGKLINPAEMCAMININNGLVANVGLAGPPLSCYDLLGLKTKVINFGNASAWADFESIMQKKGAMAVVRSTKSPYAPGGNHYFVITDVATDSSGAKTYGMYNSAYVAQTNKRHTTADLKSRLYRDCTLVWLDKKG